MTIGYEGGSKTLPSSIFLLPSNTLPSSLFLLPSNTLTSDIIHQTSKSSSLESFSYIPNLLRQYVNPDGNI